MLPLPAAASTLSPPPTGAGAAGPSAATRRPLVAVPFWRRFHVRLFVGCALLVIAIIASMGAVFYDMVETSQISALQGRLAATATALSHAISPASVLALTTTKDRAKPEYHELVELFRRTALDNAKLVSIYVLRPAKEPNMLAFAADYDRSGRAPPAQVGERYDATAAPKMFEGFRQLTIDDTIIEDRWGATVSAYAPIRDAAGRAIAILGVDMSAEDVTAVKWRVLLRTIDVFGGAALVLAFGAWRVGRSVQRPLQLVTDATLAITEGKLDTRVNLARRDEFGLLARHVDRMAEGLCEREFIRATFGRFIPEEVARRVLASRDGAALAGEEREVTVMLTDIASYSTTSETLPPGDVVRMLNTYFAEMGDVVDRHGGCVVSFIGDGLLCVFGAPIAAPDHAERAVRCAAAMRERLAELNGEWERNGLARLWQANGVPALRMRIGVHSGRVVAGNVGTRSRVTYTVIGDTVNVAARVEQLNKATRTDLLFTEATVTQLPTEIRARAVSFGAHEVKGRQQPVVVHTLEPFPRPPQ